MTRFATVDIGSNTLLLLVVELQADGSLRPIHDEAQFGRLGKGVDASGNRDPEAVRRSLRHVASFRKTLDELGVGRVAAVATQALREAGNAATFVEPAQELLCAPIEIIAGKREAELVYVAVAESFPELAAAELVAADVGGGSTEVVVGSGGSVKSFTSVPIGAVRMTERHLRSDPPTASEARDLIADIDEAIAPLDLPLGAPLIGTAGTATNLAAVELKLRDYDPERIQGFEMSPAQVDRGLARFLEQTIASRKTLPGLEPLRADVIPGGAAIFARLMHKMQAPSFIVSDRGVRWGLAYEIAAAS
jgi:exopolyphosphatase/guanosine-5'-triphosphate,3'-diphosphate pyrophosphatase